MRLVAGPALVLSISLLFSGCLAPADPPADELGETGSITGRTVDGFLNVMARTLITLRTGDPQGEVAATALSASDGFYVVEALAPGTYHVTFNDICCRMTTRTVDVRSGETVIVNAVLEDYHRGHSGLSAYTEEWNGHLECILPNPAPAGQDCHPYALNLDRRGFLTYGETFRALHLILEWEPSSPLTERLAIALVEPATACEDPAADDCPAPYLSAAGPGPLHASLYASDIAWGTGIKELEFRVTLPADALLPAYEQPFRLTYIQIERPLSM